jgi:glycerol-3-phosphate O-acyltransferase
VLTMAATDISTTQMFAQIQAQVHGALNERVKQGKANVKFVEIVKGFLDEYATTAIEAGLSPDNFKYQVQSLLKFVQEAMENPFKFEPGMHYSIRQPFDYYKWGNDFMRPLIIMDKSRLVGLENAKRMIELTNKGENVIILANHQTECDPQAISILLEREGLGEFAEKMIYIAGHKVTTDPIAIPFSMGRNLICIHSKKHIKNPPEDFPKKQAENMESMKSMGALINEGGKVIWLAPSGGRDRPDSSGNFGKHM